MRMGGGELRMNRRSARTDCSPLRTGDVPTRMECGELRTEHSPLRTRRG